MEAPIIALPYQQIGPETENLRNPSVSPAKSRFQHHIVGATLYNLGNTCFMNAVLQCFTHTVPLVEKLRDNNHNPTCSDEDGNFCSFCALREHVNQSITKSGFAIFPRIFAYNLSKISSYFKLGDQQDAHEFLSCFLDSIHTSYLKPMQKDYPSSSSEESPVDQLFRGLLRSQLRCLDCGHCSDTDDPILGLSLEIDDVDNLTDALMSFTKAEMMDDIKITCEGCKTQVSMEKQLKIKQPPNVIALHLKRFLNTETSVIKIWKFVEYPLELDLMPFLSSPRENEQLLYELYGIVVHHGYCHYGHYYSNIRTSPTTWYQMNDSSLDLISESQVLEEEAYILFYVKKGLSPWFKSFVESQMICRPGMKLKVSPSSVLDPEVNDETSSGRETGSSISKEAAPEILEKDEVCSPHANNSSGLPVDELQADNPETQRLPNNLRNKNGASSSLPSSSVTRPTNQLASDQLLSLVFRPEPLENNTENHLASQNHGSLKAISNQSKLNTVSNTDRSLTRIMKGMPSSRRLGLLACLNGSSELESKQPLGSKSAPPLKTRKKMRSDLPPLNGEESPLQRSTKARKSLSPHSIRRCLIEDDSDMSFEFGSTAS